MKYYEIHSIQVRFVFITVQNAENGPKQKGIAVWTVHYIQKSAYIRDIYNFFCFFKQ